MRQNTAIRPSPKRHFSCILSAVLGFFCAPYFIGHQIGQAAPRIQFVQTNLTFGVVYNFGYTNGRFAFSNAGDETLIIGKAEADCGCTSVKVHPEVLKPGENGELSFQIHLNEVSTYGPSQKGILVTCNDPKRPQIPLKIDLEAKPLFHSIPPEIVLNPLVVGAKTNVVVTIVRADNAKVKLTKAVSRESWGSVQIDNQSDPNGLSEQLWIAVQAQRAGALKNTVAVYAEDATLPSFFVLMHGTVLPDYSLTPTNLFWGILNPEDWGATNSTSFRTIEVAINRPGSSIKVNAVTSNIPNLRFEFNPLPTTTNSRVIARMVNPPKQSVSGLIDFEIASPKREVIHVPVEIRIMGR